MLVFLLASQFLLHGILLRMWTSNPMMTQHGRCKLSILSAGDMVLKFCGRCELLRNDRELTSNLFFNCSDRERILERFFVRSTPLRIFRLIECPAGKLIVKSSENVAPTLPKEPLHLVPDGEDNDVEEPSNNDVEEPSSCSKLGYHVTRPCPHKECASVSFDVWMLFRLPFGRRGKSLIACNGFTRICNTHLLCHVCITHDQRICLELLWTDLQINSRNCAKT